MTAGPEHYRLAEHWLRLAKSGGDGESDTLSEGETAQAHGCAAIGVPVTMDPSAPLRRPVS